MCAALCCVCIPLEDRALLLSYFPSFYSSRLSSLRTWRFFFLLPAHKPRTNATPTNKLEDKMKRIFRSEGSDVAAQRRSRVYVCVCAQGLGAAYRFEQFRPTKIQIDSTLGWEISSAHKHTHTRYKNKIVCLRPYTWTVTASLKNYVYTGKILYLQNTDSPANSFILTKISATLSKVMQCDYKKSLQTWLSWIISE